MFSGEVPHEAHQGGRYAAGRQGQERRSAETATSTP